MDTDQTLPVEATNASKVVSAIHRILVRDHRWRIRPAPWWFVRAWPGRSIVIAPLKQIWLRHGVDLSSVDAALLFTHEATHARRSGGSCVARIWWTLRYLNLGGALTTIGGILASVLALIYVGWPSALAAFAVACAGVLLCLLSGDCRAEEEAHAVAAANAIALHLDRRDLVRTGVHLAGYGPAYFTGVSEATIVARVAELTEQYVASLPWSAGEST